MKTLIEEKPVMESEKILIYTNNEEIGRITQEAEARAALLNQILNHGLLTNERLKDVSASLSAIDDFIFREQLQSNKEMKKQFEAGKKNVRDEYALPQNLESLKYLLTSWLNYPKNYREGGKYQHLTYADKWKVDLESLEKEFTMRSLKLYVESEQAEELKQLQSFGDYLSKKADPGQVFSNLFLSQRFTSDRTQACNSLPVAKFMLKASYFRK